VNRLGWAELTSLGLLFVITLHLTAVGGALVGFAALGVMFLAARCFIQDAQVDEALARLDRPLGDVIDGHTGGRRG
jgi:hypothetical protein